MPTAPSFPFASTPYSIPGSAATRHSGDGTVIPTLSDCCTRWGPSCNTKSAIGSGKTSSGSFGSAFPTSTTVTRPASLPCASTSTDDLLTCPGHTSGMYGWRNRHCGGDGLPRKAPMALYWHPFLAELLRHDYGDRLIVEEEVVLGDMPLKADLLLIRRDPTVALPFPFDLLGERTLVEYKSPDDAATQADLVKLEIYGLLYAWREGIAQRRDLTLWLIASQFRRQVSLSGGAHLAGEQNVGRGVKGGTLDGFPTFFIDLHQLPFQPEVLSLLMVAKGPKEQEMVEFLVDHFHDYPWHVRFLRELHVQTLREVLRMRQLTPEQIGIEYRALLDLIGEERVVDLIGEERVVDLIGEERVVDLIGEERLVEDILRRKGAQWLRAI